MSRRAVQSMILLILSPLLLVLCLRALTWGETGLVEVRVTDHRAGIGDFTAFWIELANVSLHPRGYPRRQGWVEVLRHVPPVDIVPLKDGRGKTVGGGPVEARRYDAVRVRLGTAQGILHSGRRAEVVPIGSTVAVDLAVELETTHVILIDLYVEDRSEHYSGRYAVKIRAIQVQGC